MWVWRSSKEKGTREGMKIMEQRERYRNKDVREQKGRCCCEVVKELEPREEDSRTWR